MFKMIKYACGGTAAVLALGFLLFGTDLFSYGATALARIQQGARDAVPAEFELQRIDDLIRDIDPELVACRRELARAELAGRRLAAEIESLEAQLAAGERHLEEGATALAVGGLRSAEFSVAQYAPDPRPQVSAGSSQVRRQLDAVLRLKSRLEDKRQQLAGSHAAVEAMREQIAVAEREQQSLRDQLTELRSNKLEIEARAATGSLQPELDTGALASARRGLTALRDRFEVDLAVLDSAGQELQPAFGAEPAAGVLADVRAYFEARGDTVTK